MTVDSVVLRRGLATNRDVKEAFDRLGIAVGEDFAIVRPEAVQEDGGAGPDDRRLGGFARDSETSRQAALDNYPRQGSQRERILAALIRNPYGRTAQELASECGMPVQSAGPRLLELRRGGWAQPTGDTRRTRTGSKAAVYEATPKARDYGRPLAGADWVH